MDFDHDGKLCNMQCSALDEYMESGKSSIPPGALGDCSKTIKFIIINNLVHFFTVESLYVAFKKSPAVQ